MLLSERASLLMAVTFLLVGPASAFSADTRPNVLMIAVDDLNDWIGCLGGHPQAKTPNIDRLARSGMLFTRSYCAAPVCNPSRAALLTGKRPSTSGVYYNSQPWRPAMPNAVTLSQHFMANGYHAAGCGKIFHGAFPEDASWNEYYRQKQDPRPGDEIRKAATSHAGGITWGELDVDDTEMNDHKVVDWAIERLQKKHDKPLFLACGIFKPHMPWQVPRKYYDMIPLDSIELPKVLETDLDDVPEVGRQMAKPDGDHKAILESGNWKRAVQAYLASMAFADSEIGRLLDAFDKSQYKENTIVCLWGDHGWHLGEKLHWRKFSLWEESARAPLIFLVPGVTKAGSSCARTVDFMDVYPTLADLCGLPVPSELEGHSLSALLKDPGAEWKHFGITTYGRNNHAVRSERFRYIRYHDGSEELYDHEKDPMEWTNLADKPEFANVKKELAAALPATNVPDARSANPRQSDERRQQRRARKGKAAAE
ncbi:MAG: sulfatase [Planctomycetaceae bacterium]